MRLQSYLAAKGCLVREELPDGSAAWCRASRSGSPFSARSVQRLLGRGTFCVKRKGYTVELVEGGRVIATPFA